MEYRINRLYYACFYAVTSLLLSGEIETKTHSGTKQLFGLHFVKTGKISEENNKLYTKLFHMRQSADYEDGVEYTESDLLPLMAPVQELIFLIDEILSKAISAL